MNPLAGLARTIAASTLVLAAVCASADGANSELKIAVIGGNGMIGQRIVAEALDRGHLVTIVVRDPSRVTTQRERLDVRQGDALDSKQVAGLIAEHDVLVSAVGSARAQQPDPTVYLKTAESLTRALRSLGSHAPRLIVVGGVGSLKNASGRVIVEQMPPERQPESLGQKAALDYYRTVNDVSWTYLSPPGRIAPGKRTGVFRLGDDQIIVDDRGQSHISMEDYAVAVVDEAEKPQHEHRRFTIGY